MNGYIKLLLVAVPLALYAWFDPFGFGLRPDLFRDIVGTSILFALLIWEVRRNR